MGQKLIDVKEAASLLNVKVGTIYLWAAQKKDGLPKMVQEALETRASF